MSQSPNETEALPIAEVAERLSKLVEEVAVNSKSITIEKEGVPVAVIISMNDWQVLLQRNDQIERRWQLLEMMREPFRDVSPEEIERETEQAVAEVKAEMKAERLSRAKIA